MAAPTFVQEAETSWNSTTSPKTTASFNVLANDVLVAFAELGDNTAITLSDNSGGALTWTQQQAVAVNNFAWVSVWTCVVPANRSGLTVTFTRGNPAANFGGNVLTFRGSSGVGNSSKTNTSGAPSLSLTTSGANSVIVVANCDWNATNASTHTWRTVNGITPTSGNGLEVSFDNSGAGSSYVPYGAYYSDAGAAGAQTVGLTAPTGQKYSIVAVEILAGAGGTSDTAPQGVSVGQGSAPTANVTGSQGVAPATGSGPSPKAAGTQGVSAGVGTSPSRAVANSTQGVGVTTGVSPTAKASGAQGVGSGQGVAPSAVQPVSASTSTGVGSGPLAVAQAGRGVGVGQGLSPSDSLSSGDTAPQGRATAIGTAPSALAIGSVGSAAAIGRTPVVRATGTIGVAVAQGASPTVAAAVTFAAIVTHGRSPATVALVGQGTALGVGVRIGVTLPNVDLPTQADIESHTTTAGLESRATAAGLESRMTTAGIDGHETTAGIDG